MKQRPFIGYKTVNRPFLQIVVEEIVVVVVVIDEEVPTTHITEEIHWCVENNQRSVGQGER
jgi:hypothetical protein